MNYLNLIILVLIGVYILQGFHKGFLVSLGNTLGMVISWIVSFLFSPMLATSISEGSFYKFLLNFTEGSVRMFDPTLGNDAVVTLSQTQIHNIVSTSESLLPTPFGKLIEQNMSELAFGRVPEVSTVADYFDHTVANVVVNILAFLIIYVLARVIIALVLNTVNYASPMPVLKRCDGLAGGAMGFIRGFFDMYAIAMIVPVIMISMPVGVEIFSEMVWDSSMATYFYEHNFLLNYVSGII